MKFTSITEDEIELFAEKLQDKLDFIFMNTEMRAAHYEHESRALARWVNDAVTIVKHTKTLIAHHKNLMQTVNK